MESIDLNFDVALDFFVGSNGLPGIVAAVALILAAIRLKHLAEINIGLIRLDKTMEENTDALIDNTRANDATNKKL